MKIILRFVDENGFIREHFFILYMSKISLHQLLKNRYIQLFPIMIFILKIFEGKVMMVLIIYIVNGMDYNLYFSRNALMLSMFIA